MEVLDAYWTPRVNILFVQCACGEIFEVRANKRWVSCPKCYCRADMLLLKSGSVAV